MNVVAFENFVIKESATTTRRIAYRWWTARIRVEKLESRMPRVEKELKIRT